MASLIGEFIEENKNVQRTSRLLIDENSNKYKIDYICKTNPKIFWRCFVEFCPARVYTFGYRYPIYFINSNHNHVKEQRPERAQSKYREVNIRTDVKSPEVIRKKNVIHHFKTH